MVWTLNIALLLLWLLMKYGVLRVTKYALISDTWPSSWGQCHGVADGAPRQYCCMFYSREFRHNQPIYKSITIDILIVINNNIRLIPWAFSVRTGF